MKIMQEKFKVYERETDPKGRLRLAPALHYAQQVAGEQSELGTGKFERVHAAFFLVRMAIRFARVPVAGEVLTVETEPSSPVHAVYKRVNRFMDESGRQVALMDSRWTLVDTQSRRILRKIPEGLDMDFGDPQEELPMKIARPEQTEEVGIFCARYSMCDKNGHLNNTVYADLICDALPIEELLDGTVEELRMAYHKELPLGTQFTMNRAMTGDGEWYVSAQRDGQLCFEAILKLTR